MLLVVVVVSGRAHTPVGAAQRSVGAAVSGLGEPGLAGPVCVLGAAALSTRVACTAELLRQFLSLWHTRCCRHTTVVLAGVFVTGKGFTEG